LGTYITPQGTQTLQADKVLYKPSENYLHLTGNAILSDGQRTLQADTIVYNETKNEARACGSRPLVTGTSEQGTFAIIADNVTSDAEGNKVFLDGKVQGWLVAPAINNNQLNSKF
jgi:lipopolysaccharide assembly outer membrane protein LptD (OstA)